MNEANTRMLMLDFPRLYRDAADDESRMSRRFTCGDGWFNLIYELSAAIEAEARKIGLNPMSDDWPRAVQIKEKLGTLRFYIRTSSVPGEFQGVGQENRVSMRPVARIDAIRSLVEEAEETSANICENCGQAGVLREAGGARVTCDHCESI